MQMCDKELTFKIFIKSKKVKSKKESKKVTFYLKRCSEAYAE